MATKILVPMHYYTSGFSGDSSYNITMSSENTGYEARKAFTVDRNEFLEYTNEIIMGTKFASAGTQGVYMDSDEIFDSTSKNFHLKRNTTIQTPTGVWGHSNVEVSGDHVEVSSGVTGRVLMLASYSSQGSYFDYRFSITNATNDRIQSLMHGVLYDMPGNYSEEREVAYEYPKSKTYSNLLGNIRFDGLSTPGIKRKHTVIFNEVNSTDRDLLITIYTLGKGGAPILWVGDTSNDSTWMVCGMKELVVTEPYVDAYNLSLTLEEF